MRIFFAASIGVQVPIKDLIDGKVIGTSVLFTLSLIGKLALGLIVPNFNNATKFRRLHLREDLIDGKVIRTGVLFTLLLIGKLVLGLIVPNFNNATKFRGLNLRDCLITGLSMVRTEMDLVICGMGAPVATVLMANMGVKTAVF